MAELTRDHKPSVSPPPVEGKHSNEGSGKSFWAWYPWLQGGRRLKWRAGFSPGDPGVVMRELGAVPREASSFPNLTSRARGVPWTGLQTGVPGRPQQGHDFPQLCPIAPRVLGPQKTPHLCPLVSRAARERLDFLMSFGEQLGTAVS